jgi:hypothetical protein
MKNRPKRGSVLALQVSEFGFSGAASKESQVLRDVAFGNNENKMLTKFDNCILHIGTEKTGTTTLQRYLALNRDEFLKQGYFIPSSLSPYPDLANHERLTTYALNPMKTSDDLRIAAGLKSSDEVSLHRANIVEGLRNEIAAITGNPRTLLLSNEHCHSRLVEDEEVSLLKAMLGEFVDSFRIIVYLRPQHDLAVSLYSQALKAGLFDINVLPEFDRMGQYWVRKRYFNYLDLLTRWSSAFEIQNITARIYSKEDLVEGSIIDDFMSVIRADRSSLTKTENLNPSMSEEFQPALNAFNRFSHNNPHETTPEHRTLLIQTLESLSKGARFQPIRCEVEKFLQIFDESNEEVRREFFPNRDRLFETDFSGYPEVAGPPVAENDALIRTILHLLGRSMPHE